MTEATNDALVKRLQSYEQADADGVMVLISRQAVDEAIAALSTPPAGEHEGECRHEYVRLPQVADGKVCHKCGEQLCPVCGTASPHWIPFNVGVLARQSDTAPHSWTHREIGNIKRDDELSTEEKECGEWLPLYTTPPDTRRLALEEAAKVCDEQEKLHQSTDQKAAIRFVGYAIRALAAQQPERKGE